MIHELKNHVKKLRRVLGTFKVSGSPLAKDLYKFSIKVLNKSQQGVLAAVLVWGEEGNFPSNKFVLGLIF